MSEYAIFAEGLGRRFGEVMAVDSVDLSVSRGEIYGFLGPNGAGKSTTVRMLITLLMPTKGRAFVGGKDVVQRAQEVRLIIGAAYKRQRWITSRQAVNCCGFRAVYTASPVEK